MRIGIIGGTGPQGRGLAARLGAAGIEALVGSRELDRARETVERLRAPSIHAGTNDDVVERCDVVFLAVPFAGAGDLVERYRGRFRQGSVVVDMTVPLVFDAGVPSLVDVREGSAAEHLRTRLAPEVRLAAALKTIPAAVLGRLDAALDCDEFVCGDSPDARAAVMDILGRIPALRPIDAGGLDAARTLERMTLLAVEINKRHRIRGARYRVIGL